MTARTPAYRRRVKPVDVVKQILEPLSRHKAAIERRIEETDREVAKIDPRMQEKYRREAERELRAKAAEAMAADLRAMLEYREALVAQKAHYRPEAIRARAKYDADPLRNAQIGSYTLAQLSVAPPLELRLLAEEALSEGDLARAQAVRHEALRRSDLPDELRADVLALADQVPLPPEEAAVSEALERGLDEVALLQTRVGEAFTGKSNPLGRLAAAYGDHTQSVGIPGTDGSSASPADRLHAAYSAAE